MITFTVRTAAILYFLISPAGAQPDSAAVDTAKHVSSNPQRTNDAILYYNALTAPIAELNEANYQYVEMVAKTRKTRKVEKMRKQLLKSLDETREHMNAFAPFEEDDTLRHETIRYLGMFRTVLKQDFDKILDMEDINEQAYDEAEAHQLAVRHADEKLAEAFKVYRKAQEAFFKKYEIINKQEETEVARKTVKANNALEYHHAISQIFLRVNNQDGYARKAAGQKDVSSLEQDAMTLVSFAKEGLEELADMDLYKGDSTLLAAAEEILHFYKHEGEKTYPAIVEHHLKADHFEKRVKKFNAIKPARRTQKVIDKYNNMVNEYNEGARAINKIQNDSYKTHKKLIKKWNKTSAKFTGRHATK